MSVDALAAWLLEHGGPAVRYRTATELSSTPPHDVDHLEHELLASPAVQTWLKRLEPPTTSRDIFVQIHHSKDGAFENVMGKLLQYGCHGGMSAFDARTTPWIDWLDSARQPDDAGLGSFLVDLVAAFLWMAGYRDGAVKEHVTERLGVIAEFARTKRYDIYVDQDTYPGFPASYHNHQLIDPAIYHDGRMRLPRIHDLLAFAHGQELLDSAQIDAVIDYVLDNRYQSLPDGYGVVRTGHRRFYAMGWDCKLPGYFGFDDLNERAFVQRVVLMAHFPGARAHRWLAGSLERLEQFRTEAGTYLFPPAYLTERTSYGVLGGRMAIEDGRRTKRVREIESTFWMATLQRLMGA